MSESSTLKTTIKQLIDFESREVTYQTPMPGAPIGFRVEEGRRGRVIISAPHGSRCYRPGDKDDYHTEDEYTAALAHWLHQRLNLPAIYMVKRSATDPNFHRESPYKQTLGDLLRHTGAKLVLDIHGAAFTRQFAVDLGCMGENNHDIKSCPRVIIQRFRELWHTRFQNESLVTVNHFPATSQPTVTRFVADNFGPNTWGLQMEINALYRIPERKRDATNGGVFPPPQDIKPQRQRIMRMLDVLVQFLEEIS